MNYLEDQLENKALVIEPREGELLAFGTSSVLLRLCSNQTNNQLGIYQITLDENTEGAKLHYHRYMDETFIVNSGVVTIQTGDKVFDAKPDTIVHIPRFTPHAFKNQSSTKAVITLIFNPGERREGFFRGLQQVLKTAPVDPGDFLKLYNKYDSYLVDNTIQEEI